MSMVTIKDVARLVGCSPSTVARALNDSPSISLATRARVQEAAQQLGYVAHMAARLMRGDPGTVIGLTVPDIENQFYATLARAVAEVCREAGFQLVLSITEDDPEIEFEHIRALISAQASGAVIVPSPKPLDKSLDLLKRLPTVQLIRSTRPSPFDSFSIDESFGIREATRHLLELGHEHIVYVGADKGLSTGRERVRGFEAAFSDAEKQLNKEWIVLGTPRASFALAAFPELYRKHQPTAVVCGGSQITVGVLHGIKDLGLSVPGQLSFVAYDDHSLFRSWAPSLTSIALPIREIALAGTSFLIRRIRASRDGDKDNGLQTALYQPRLIIRESTSPPIR